MVFLARQTPVMSSSSNWIFLQHYPEHFDRKATVGRLLSVGRVKFSKLCLHQMEYLVTSSFNLYLVNGCLMNDKDFQKNVETRLDI